MDEYSFLFCNFAVEMIDYSVFNGKRAAFFTLGCKLNFAETSTLGETLMSYGVTKAKKGEVADICIVNTCTVMPNYSPNSSATFLESISS